MKPEKTIKETSPIIARRGGRAIKNQEPQPDSSESDPAAALEREIMLATGQKVCKGCGA